MLLQSIAIAAFLLPVDASWGAIENWIRLQTLLCEADKVRTWYVCRHLWKSTFLKSKNQNKSRPWKELLRVHQWCWWQEKRESTMMNFGPRQTCLSVSTMTLTFLWVRQCTNTMQHAYMDDHQVQLRNYSLLMAITVWGTRVHSLSHFQLQGVW